MANVVVLRSEDRLKRLMEQYREICLSHIPVEESPFVNLASANGGGPYGEDDEDTNQQQKEDYTLDEWSTGIQEHRNIV